MRERTLLGGVTDRPTPLWGLAGWAATGAFAAWAIPSGTEVRVALFSTALSGSLLQLHANRRARRRVTGGSH